MSPSTTLRQLTKPRNDPMKTIVRYSLVVCCIALLSATGWSAEPTCSDDECSQIPLLSRLPYLGKLFKNKGVAQPVPCAEELPAPEQIPVQIPTGYHPAAPVANQCIGIDLDC